jgi:hypothetical protein
MAEFDYKEYARQLRENAAKDDNGVIRCSPELWEQIANVIENIPTVDVAEVRHGRWIKHKPDSEYIKGLHQLGIAKGMGKNSIYWTCSECEHWGVLHYKYCPNCGSRMDGDEDEL